jgi:hypothetical protein
VNKEINRVGEKAQKSFGHLTMPCRLLKCVKYYKSFSKFQLSKSLCVDNITEFPVLGLGKIWNRRERSRPGMSKFWVVFLNFF